MADSERMRGNRSPVTDYKIGNGGIRDLFKYILGDDKTRNSMKIVKTRSGKSTIIKNKAQKNAVVNTVKKVMVNDSNAVSAMAGDRARNIQRNMAANMNQRVEPARVTGEDQTNRMRMMATYPNVVQDDRGPTAIVEPVVVENLPEAPMMSEEELQARLDAENPDSEILKERTIRAGDGLPPEYSMGYDTIGKFYMGGKVKTKKKKKKKLANGVKVTSYNY